MLDVSFDFYTDTYGGTVIASSSVFNKVITRANAKYAQIKRVYTIVADNEINERLAVCTIVDNLYTLEERQGVTSVSEGGYSISYSDKDRTLAEAIEGDIQYYVELYRGLD